MRTICLSNTQKICKLLHFDQSKKEIKGENGRNDRIRTCDTMSPRHMRYQTALRSD